MTSGVSVELDELTRLYGNVKALDRLTLHIQPGELVALLGPSGCGKTTALRILAGLDEAASGTVSVAGHDISRVPANKRDMGMVFQAYSLFPHLTVLDNVAFGLKMRGKAKGERQSRAADMLDLVGLSAHKHKYASELSGGQAPSSGTTSTGLGSTPTATRSPVENVRATELGSWALTAGPSSRLQCTREIGPRNATDVTVAFPLCSADTVTDSGRTIASPAPEVMEPPRVGTDAPRIFAVPPETCAGTLLFSPTNSATNGDAGFAYSSAGAASCSSRPWLITPTRSATARASS